MEPPFLHRELAWLDFNEHVLEEAEDPGVPLLERVKFLGIFSSNLDEFFMVRVAGLWRQVAAGDADANRVLARVSDRVHRLVDRQHRLFVRTLLPALRREGISVMLAGRLDSAGQAWVNEWFHRNVLPLLTPLAIDPGHPFPYLANRAICLLVELEPLVDDPLPVARTCVVHVPASGLPRFIEVPSPPGRHRFVLLEDVVRSHLHEICAGYRVISASAIRVTRDAEFDAQEDQAEDLMVHVEEAVRSRRLGEAVRLQYERTLPPRQLQLLASELDLQPTDLYAATGPTALTDVMQVYTAVRLAHLRDAPHSPRSVLGDDPFATIRERDVLVHHPYDEFDAVTRFIEAAAVDPSVVAVKMTLYRVTAESRIAQALARAASEGKQVAVLVELRARFSEEANIAWARRLEAIGAHVVYGLPGVKTHCKAALVVRREDEGLRRYAHLATGNYNHQTAAIYTDYGLFTASEEIGEDLTHLFNLLTGYARPPATHHLVVAPHALRPWLLARIADEARAAREGRPCGIDARLNALTDREIASALYAASAAGVPVRLMVRGPCCLRAGVPRWSERIEVLRIVDRFLEHARMYRFVSAGGTWLGSADWMGRNLDARVEVAWPLLDASLRAQVDQDFELQWADTAKSRTLAADGRWRRRTGTSFRSQDALRKRGSGAGASPLVP